MKVASFHVRATEAQSVRWKRAADSAGVAVGNWLARAADARLQLEAGVFAWPDGEGGVREDGAPAPPAARGPAPLAPKARLSR